LTGQVVRLVESATDGTDDVQRDGYDRVGLRQHVMARLTEDDTQRLGEEPPPFIFERVDEIAQWAVVPPRATRNRERGRICRAALAAIREIALFRTFGPTEPGTVGPGQFVAAGLTERRRDAFKTVPAVVTDRAAEWRVQ